MRTRTSPSRGAASSRRSRTVGAPPARKTAAATVKPAVAIAALLSSPERPPWRQTEPGVVAPSEDSAERDREDEPPRRSGYACRRLHGPARRPGKFAPIERRWRKPVPGP